MELESSADRSMLWYEDIFGGKLSSLPLKPQEVAGNVPPKIRLLCRLFGSKCDRDYFLIGF